MAQRRTQEERVADLEQEIAREKAKLALLEFRKTEHGEACFKAWNALRRADDKLQLADAESELCEAIGRATTGLAAALTSRGLIP